jgi:hypothetical protein
MGRQHIVITLVGEGTPYEDVGRAQVAMDDRRLEGVQVRQALGDVERYAPAQRPRDLVVRHRLVSLQRERPARAHT